MQVSSYPNIFNTSVSDQVIQRINKLKPETAALWGKMSVDQMLAHCNVPYEMAFTNKHPEPNFILGFILKTFVKDTVVGTKPYKKHSQTAPAFVIKGSRNFENEKVRLISYIKQAQQLGEKHFDGKKSNSFGNLNADEWNTMFYKHIDHHLQQFGA
ncbi:MAG: DUF1569 domain-containing protein [Bacteroidota bacterium]